MVELLSGANGGPSLIFSLSSRPTIQLSRKMQLDCTIIANSP